MNIVDWEHPVIKMRKVKGEDRRERRFSVICGGCGETRWLKRCDALEAEQSGAACFRCTQREKARLGYKATVAKHGKDFALPYVRDYQLAHPSVLNMAMADILEHVLELPYEREVICGSYLIDFVLYGTFAIEVNGGVHVLQPDHDVRKARFLREQGYDLLVLEQADIPDASARVLEFIGACELVAV
jgi:very-short-patch-repair endonuclease